MTNSTRQPGEAVLQPGDRISTATVGLLRQGDVVRRVTGSHFGMEVGDYGTVAEARSQDGTQIRLDPWGGLHVGFALEFISRPLIPASDLEQVSRERDEAVRLLRDAGVCAYDLDERTVTLALDTEDQVRALIAALPAKHRAFLNTMEDRDGGENV